MKNKDVCKICNEMLDTEDLLNNIEVMLEKPKKNNYISLEDLLSYRNFTPEEEEDIIYMHKIYKKEFMKCFA